MVMPYLLQQVTSTEGMELVIVIVSLFSVMYFILSPLLLYQPFKISAMLNRCSILHASFSGQY